MEIAAQLDAAADGAAARGAPAVGANLLELAADLTPDDLSLARHRRRRAAVLHRVSGSTPRAIAILEALRDAAEPGPERADVLAELAENSFKNPSVVVSLCNDALIEAAGDDRRSARLLAHRSLHHMTQGNVAAALADGRAALELAERLDDPALIAVAIAHISHAETRSVETTRLLLDRGVQIERAHHLALEFLDSPRRALARQQMRMGEVEQARSLLEELAREASACGDENTRACCSGCSSSWTGSQADGQRLLTSRVEAAIAGEQSQAVDHRWLIVRKALVEADLGLLDDARASARYALSGTVAGPTRFAEIEMVAVLGRIELMLGNGRAAADLLRDLPDQLITMGSDDPTAFVWADTIEALIEAGDIARARHVFAQWVQRADQQGGPWALATTSRCRALLAAVDRNFAAAERSFSESLASLDGFSYPLERARTLLCLGSVSRQAQQRAAAREALEQALRMFEELGGRLWADKARNELARVSGRRPPEAMLTETERQVAELAGTGRSNSEIAASLHLGVSTVEAHLSSVYRKLDVRRAGLAARLAEVSRARWGMQCSSYSAITMSAGSSEHAGHSGSRQHLVGAERLLERVVREEATGKRVAETEDELDRLERLDRADDAGQHAEHAGLGAGRSELGGRRLGHHAPVARPDVRMEHRRLTLEPEDRSVDDRDALLERRVVQEVARREVVGAVDDDVVAVDDVEHVARVEPRVVRDDVRLPD